jgi:MFS family permease
MGRAWRDRRRPAGGARYRAVLAAPGAPYLLATSVLARLPLGMVSLAALLLLRERTGSFAAAGAGVGAFSLAQAAVAPVQGALVDRLGQRRVLLPCAGAHALLLAGLVVAAGAGAPAALLVVLAGLAGAVLPPVAACLRVLWPLVAPDPARRETAYALDAVTQEIIWTVGPVAVALVVALASPAAAVALCAAVTLGGTLAFAASALTRRAPRLAAGGGRRGALASPGLRLLLLTAVLMGACIGALEVGFPSLAVHAGAPRLAGVLLSLWSVGSMAGGLWYGARAWRGRVEVRYAALLATIALTTAPLLAVHGVAPALVASALSGVAYAPALSCQMALVQAAAPAGAITEAFTWSTAAIAAGIAGGAALAGWLVEAAGVGVPFALGCAAAGAAAALSFARRARFARGAGELRPA